MKLSPVYKHRFEEDAPPSCLSVLTAGPVFIKLSPFLAIRRKALRPNEPARDRVKRGYSRDLFTPRGFHHPVRWMPRLKSGWRRLSYHEFWAWYGLPDEAKPKYTIKGD